MELLGGLGFITLFSKSGGYSREGKASIPWSAGERKILAIFWREK
jgi:hypothetical protein